MLRLLFRATRQPLITSAYAVGKIFAFTYMPLSDHSTAEFASTCPLDHWKAETVIFCRLATSDIHPIFDLTTCTLHRNCHETKMQLLGEAFVHCTTNANLEPSSLTRLSHFPLVNVKAIRKGAAYHWDHCLSHVCSKREVMRMTRF